jgi:hypothetical protein
VPPSNLPDLRAVAQRPRIPARVVEIPPGDARLQRAMAWWQGLCTAAGGALPDRAHLDPAAITDLLPYGILWDVLTDETGARLFRCRLAGTLLEENLGRGGKGMTPAEMYGDDAAAMQEMFQRVADSRQPLCTYHDMGWAQKDYCHYYRLSLPFTLRAANMADPDGVGLLFNVVSIVTS